MMINTHDYHQFLGTPGREGNWGKSRISTLYRYHLPYLLWTNRTVIESTEPYVRLYIYTYI